jgi:hypothetical protein
MSWLAKLTISLSLVGVVGYDAVSLVHTRVSAADVANRAAIAASVSWAEHRNAGSAYTAAKGVADEAGATVPTGSFAIAPDGSAHLAVRETAPTFVLHHIGPAQRWTVVTESGSALATPW